MKNLILAVYLAVVLLLKGFYKTCQRIDAWVDRVFDFDISKSDKRHEKSRPNFSRFV